MLDKTDSYCCAEINTTSAIMDVIIIMDSYRMKTNCFQKDIQEVSVAVDQEYDREAIANWTSLPSTCRLWVVETETVSSSTQCQCTSRMALDDVHK